MDEDLLVRLHIKKQQGQFSNKLLKKHTFYTDYSAEDSIFKVQVTEGDAAVKQTVTIPIVVEHMVVAFVSLATSHSFSSESKAVLEQLSLVLNSHYSSLLANERTSVLAENVSIYNQQLEAQSTQLAKAQERAEEANQAKSAFLANMSHEIRTPMSAIIGLTHLMRRAILAHEQSARLGKIEDAAGHLLNIINDILDISKIEAGKLVLEQTDFHLDAIFDHVQSLLREQAKAKGLTIEVD